MPLVRIHEKDGREITYGGYRPAQGVYQSNGRLSYRAEFPECDRAAGTAVKFSVDGGPLRDIKPAIPLNKYVSAILYFDRAPA